MTRKGWGTWARRGWCPYTGAWRTPLWVKRIIWHLDGHAGRSIRIWIKLKRLRYNVGVGIAERICRGPHTDSWQSHDGNRCLCDRVRRRLDFVPF